MDNGALYATLISVLGFVLFFVYCLGNDKKAIENKSPRELDLSFNGSRVVTFEGCEYIEFTTSPGWRGYIHKGNCKNPIHYCKCSEKK